MPYNLPETIISRSFHLAVSVIERFNNMEPYQQKAVDLHNMPPGTLGHEVARCLDEHKLRLVPGYESHDLKHTLLGYDMTPIDEIRLQAFMLANGNISWPSVVIFLFGCLLLPYKWPVFIQDILRGYQALPIKDWTLDEYAPKDLQQLRQQVFDTEVTSPSIFSKLTYTACIFSMLAGGLGMLFCLPWLFSPVLEDLVGAGFPFVGGAILFVGGLIGLSMQSRKEAAVAPALS